MLVKDLMSKNVIIVYGGDTIQKVSEEMAKHNHGIVAVFNDNKNREVIGVVSNKDIINKVISKKISPENMRASDIMSKPISINSDKTTSEAMIIIRKYDIKRILVIDQNTLQGIISSQDLVNGMIRYKKELLDLALDF